jgi:hypothetical protein
VLLSCPLPCTTPHSPSGSHLPVTTPLAPRLTLPTLSLESLPTVRTPSPRIVIVSQNSVRHSLPSSLCFVFRFRSALTRFSKSSRGLLLD